MIYRHVKDFVLTATRKNDRYEKQKLKTLNNNGEYVKRKTKNKPYYVFRGSHSSVAISDSI